MSNIDPNEIKAIPKDRWEEWCTMFTNGNRGRLVKVEVKDVEYGLQTLAENVELVALDYDPEGKGNQITLSLGSQLSPNRHIVLSPVKIEQMQNENGLVTTVVIEDNYETRNVVMLR